MQSTAIVGHNNRIHTHSHSHSHANVVVSVWIYEFKTGTATLVLQKTKNKKPKTTNLWYLRQSRIWCLNAIKVRAKFVHMYGNMYLLSTGMWAFKALLVSIGKIKPGLSRKIVTGEICPVQCHIVYVMLSCPLSLYNPCVFFCVYFRLSSTSKG